MEFIKKFAKEMSVFALVIVIFLALFLYRSVTFKDYKTISETKLTQMVENKEDFFVVLGDSTDETVYSFQQVVKEYTTKNRDTTIYYVDSSNNKEFDAYVEKTFGINVAYPATLAIKDGVVTAKSEKALNYYYFKDFVETNK